MRPDPITREIFKHLLASVAEEMGVRLMRSAYSPNIKERRDFSCALFDAQGTMMAQAAHIPVHLGSTPLSVQAVLAAFPPAEMRAGDRFILNDPYAGGTHLPDLTVVAPCLLPGSATPRFFVANRAHHADVGGQSPGSMPISTHIDQEGVRISPRRLDAQTRDWICAESRTPDERRGDLMAQEAALEVGLARLEALCVTYGADHVQAQAAALQDYTARLMEALLQDIPDGTYHATDYLDDDGHGTTDIALRCTVTIAGKTATVDFSASDDQVKGPVNAVRAIAVSAVHYVFRCLASADLPSNAGLMRPIVVRTRPGSVVEAQYPAAVAGGNVETSQRLVDVVFAALAQALPERIPAASCGSMNNLTIGGLDPRTGSPFAYYETLAGGAGGSPEGPGGSAVHTHMTNTLNTPVEALEHAYPFTVDAYRIRSGSGGTGLHPGGDGLVRRYAFGAPAQVTLLTDRRRHRPYGLHGGAPGQPGKNILLQQGRASELPSKCSIPVAAGDVLEIHTPGGGGWGSKIQP